MFIKINFINQKDLDQFMFVSIISVLRYIIYDGKQKFTKLKKKNFLVRNYNLEV